MSETNSHLERLKRLASPSPTPPPPVEEDEGYSAFASGRLGTKPQLTLVFRRVTGSCHAFAYAHLYALEYDPSVGILLKFTQHRVALLGRHLDDLFRYLCLHRVQTVQETDPLHAETLPQKTPVVVGIERTESIIGNQLFEAPNRIARCFPSHWSSSYFRRWGHLPRHFWSSCLPSSLNASLSRRDFSHLTHSTWISATSPEAPSSYSLSS